MFLPMFSWNVFRTNLIDEGYITHQQLEAMKKESYTMRKENPVGRNRSNNSSGWQSNDGVNDRPIFQSLLNGVESVFNNEVFPYYMGEHKDNYKLEHGNYWVNINYNTSYNNPHTHPGCWYSGAFYVQIPEETRNDGWVQFLRGQSHHMSDFTHMSRRDADNFGFIPKEGDLLLFPSAMIHYVEPHSSDFERISIAFNNSFRDIRTGDLNQAMDRTPNFNDVMEFNVLPDGNIEFPK